MNSYCSVSDRQPQCPVSASLQHHICLQVSQWHSRSFPGNRCCSVLSLSPLSFAVSLPLSLSFLLSPLIPQFPCKDNNHFTQSDTFRNIILQIVYNPLLNISYYHLHGIKYYCFSNLLWKIKAQTGKKIIFSVTGCIFKLNWQFQQTGERPLQWSITHTQLFTDPPLLSGEMSSAYLLWPDPWKWSESEP